MHQRPSRKSRKLRPAASSEAGEDASEVSSDATTMLLRAFSYLSDGEDGPDEDSRMKITCGHLSEVAACSLLEFLVAEGHLGRNSVLDRKKRKQP